MAKPDSIDRAPKSRIAVSIIAILAVSGLFAVTILEPGLHLTELRFNPFAVLSAVTLTLDLGLFLYLTHKPARTDERIWLSTFLLGLAIYAFGEMMWRLSATPDGAVFWTNVSTVGSIIPVSLYLFTLAYTSRTERRYPAVSAILIICALLITYFIAAVGIVFNNDPHTYTPHAWGFDTQVEPGAGSVFDLLWFIGIPVVSVIQLISFRRHTRNEILRRQSLIFIFAAGIPIVGGAITDLVLPLAGFVMPQFGITLFTPAAFFLIYGLLRYQLLTISPTLFSNTILAIMQEAVVATDEKFNVIYVNPTAEALLGIRLEGRAERSLIKSLPVDSVSDFHHAFTSTTNATVSIPQIQFTKRPDKTEVPIRVTSSKLRLGSFDVWVMILTDITAEVQTRSVIEHEVQVRTKELHEARAYLVSSINSLEQGFVLVNAHAKVELTNNMVDTLCSRKGEELIGQDVKSVMDMIGWKGDISSAVQNVLVSHRPRRIDTASANGLFYQIYLTPILAGRSALGAAIVIEDVTEQKILDRSKDEFFSIASHELRTPLTAIRGNMSMVEQYFPEALKDETMKTLIIDSHDASVRLIEIVNDFLDSSKLEQGKMEFRLAPMAIAPILESVKKDLTTLIEQSHNKVELVNLDKLPMIIADEGRFRQIMYNLLSNANKYSQDATVTVSGIVDGNKLRLRVADTGKGISPENQKLLFHKFQQAGDSILTRDNTKGTGLGLYIARLLATNMHGNVELEHSEVGKGSTFAILLPLANKK